MQLKLGYHCVPPAKLKTMREVSTLVYELANITPFARQPYVGRSAFAHKAGLHVSGIQRNTATYEHVDPALLGNDRRVLLSELSGRANIVYKAKEFGLELDPAPDKIGVLLDELKRLEGAGYTFDGRGRFVRAADAAHARARQRAFQLRQFPRLRRQMA